MTDALWNWIRRHPAILGVVCVFVLMWPVCSGRDRLAFRDVGYFYTPLYQYVAARSSDWNLRGDSIWNPLDHTGMPLAGETTTAVFYPVRWAVYAWPASAESHIAWYVTLHLMIAAVTASMLAMRQRLPNGSASIAGIVYPLSGGVLFLATNPPFLVGAAWMPLVLAVGMPGRSSRRDVMVAAIALSMMILGGDPHLAFLTIATLIAVNAVNAAANQSWHRTAKKVRPLIAACWVAVVLTLPQLVASIDWSRQSDRLNANGTEHAYAFSVSPWRVSEFALPNLHGTPWPTNTRWDRALFANARRDPIDALWTPTLYAGIGAVAGLVVLGRRCGRRRRWRGRTRDWSIVLVIAVTGAMGAYGPMYFVQSMTGWFPDADSAAGGPTWWLRQGVPGFDSLRYPSKWLPLAMIALAMATARFVSTRHQRPAVTKRAYGMAILIAIAWTGLSTGWLNHHVATLRSNGMSSTDPIWGPLQWNTVPLVWRTAWVHAFVALSAILMAARMERPKWRAAAMVGCIALDVMIAHANLVPRINRADESVRIASLANDAPILTGRWIRTRAEQNDPADRAPARDDDPMAVMESGWRATWFGRWHLEHGQAVFNSMTSIQSEAMRKYWIDQRQLAKSLPQAESDQQWRRRRRELGILGRVQTRPLAPSTGVPGITASWVIDETDSSARGFRLADTESGTIASADDSPEFLQADLITAEGATLVRPVYHDGHWTVTLEPLPPSTGNVTAGRSANVRSFDGLSQSVDVPAGQWRVRFAYQPWWYRPSVGIAMIGWLAVAIGLVRFRRR